MKVVVKRRDVTDLHELQGLIVDHIEGIEPGLTVLDSRLLLGQATIDVVGLDAQGALVLIAVAFTADEEMLLKAVEAYSWCLEYPEAIRRLYPSAHISTSQPPRLMFVVQRMPDAFHRKIKQLGFPVVDCVEVRSLEVDGRSAVYFETLARLRRPSAPAAPERMTPPPPPTNGRPTSLKLQRLLGGDRAAPAREPAQVVRMLHRTGPRGEAAKPVISIARREATVAPRRHGALEPAPVVTSTEDNVAVAMAVADRPAAPLTVVEPIVAAEPSAAAPLISTAEPAPAAEPTPAPALIAIPEPTPAPALITAVETSPAAALLAAVEPVGAREPVAEVEPNPAPAFVTDPVATALMSADPLTAEPDAVPARSAEPPALPEYAFADAGAPTAPLEVAAPEPAPHAAVDAVAAPEAETDPELQLCASATSEPEPARTAVAAADEMPARSDSLDAAVVEPISLDSPRVVEAAAEPEVAPAPAPSVFSRRSAEPAAVATDPRICFANVAKDLLTTTAERPTAFAKPAGLFTRPGAAKPPRTIAPPPPDPNPIAGGKPGAAAKRDDPPAAGGAPERAPATAGARGTTVPVPPEGFEALRFPHDGVLTRQWTEFLNQMAAGK